MGNHGISPDLDKAKVSISIVQGGEGNRRRGRNSFRIKTSHEQSDRSVLVDRRVLDKDDDVYDYRNNHVTTATPKIT